MGKSQMIKILKNTMQLCLLLLLQAQLQPFNSFLTQLVLANLHEG